MELSLCSYYLTNEEFGRLVRKYLSRSIDPSTQISARNLMLERLDTLSDIDGKLRHLRIISDLLEGDKYKTVKYGEYYTIQHLEQLLKQAESLNDGPETLA